MALEALLLCHDASLLPTLRRSLDEIAVKSTVCSGAASANQLLTRRKFEAIVIDCDDCEGARNLLLSLRNVPSNKNSIVFAITRGKTTVNEAFGAGANFVLEKPVAADRLTRSLRAAHSLMARERRRSFRHTIDASVLLQLGASPEVRARAADVSEGGMAVFVTPPLPKGSVITFRFVLPESAVCLEGKAQVVWSQEQGRAGLQFQTMRQDLRLDLATWLATRIEREQPLYTPMSAPPQPAPVRPRNGTLSLSLAGI
jgi:hypothetical protein